MSQEKFWVEPRQYVLDAHLIRLFQQVYKNNKVVITREAEITEPTETKMGLEQGCPLSPLLFTTYPSRTEKKLEERTLGFDVSYAERGEKVNQVIPGMFYADDIVL